jgi:transposase
LLELKGSGKGVAGGSGQGIRKPGGGRKETVDKDPTLQDDVNSLVDPVTCGDPESPLRWTCKSVRKLAAELCAKGLEASHRMVAELLHDMGYSLQVNRNTREGVDHADRNSSFSTSMPKCRRLLQRASLRFQSTRKRKSSLANSQQ